MYRGMPFSRPRQSRFGSADVWAAQAYLDGAQFKESYYHAVAGRAQPMLQPPIHRSKVDLDLDHGWLARDATEAAQSATDNALNSPPVLNDTRYPYAHLVPVPPACQLQLRREAYLCAASSSSRQGRSRFSPKSRAILIARASKLGLVSFQARMTHILDRSSTIRSGHRGQSDRMRRA